MTRRQPPSSGPARRAVVVGVDVAEEGKGLDLVALDGARRLVASHGRLARREVIELVHQLAPDLVCIDSPSGWSISGRSRQAERILAKMGIASYPTGADPGDHPFYRWMRVGMALFEGLAATYPIFRGGQLRGSSVEVFPHASAVLLAGRPRHSGETKNGFRRAVLADAGVDHAALPNIDRVDAALGALTGVLALSGDWTVVGEPAEGVVLLPVRRSPAR